MMTFEQSLKVLNIEDFRDRIFKSNSRGELFHLTQYFRLAELLKDDPGWFRDWFVSVVEYAEKNWERPESLFQHIDKILVESM